MTIGEPKLLATLLSPAALGMVALVAATGCGGGSFSSGGGESSGGDTSSGGATTIAGSSIGGGPEAGGAMGSGGASVGTGGALATGGAASSGGIGATGGTTTGSTSAACQQNSDCTVCKYDHAISTSTDCYCAQCPSMPMTRSDCEAYRLSWERYCSQVTLECSAIACVSRSPSCNNGVCTAITSSGG